MPGLHQPCELASFSDFELDVRTGELRRNGETVVRLSEQPLQILVTFLSQPGQLITRDELQAKLWPNDTIVEFEHSINAAINRLRVALGDSAKKPQFIETLARKGYRWKVAVEWREKSVSNVTIPASTHTQQTRPRWVWFFVAGGVSLIAAGIFLSWRGSAASSHARSIADWRQRQLTVNSVENPIGGGAISPDGKYLAYTDLDGIHVRPLNGNDSVKIADPAAYDHNPPTWEVGYWLPDSRRFFAIAELPLEPSALWLFSTSGDVPRQLDQDANPWRAAADGAIALTENDDHEIWELNVDTGIPILLLKAANGDRFRAVSWSPDGQHLAYIRMVDTPQGNVSHIQVLDRKTRVFRELASGPAIRTLSELEEGFQDLIWLSADRVLFVGGESDIRGVSCNLWQIRLDARSTLVISGPEKLTSWAGFCVTNMSKTADGKRLVFSRFSDSMNVLISDYNSATHKISSPQRLTLTEDLSTTVAWTLDSKAVLFRSNRLGKAGVYRQSVRGRDAESIFTGDGRIGELTVTPDRQWLLFQRIEPTSEHTISHLIKSAVSGGTEQEVLAEQQLSVKCGRSGHGRCVLAEVSPTGNELVFFELDPIRGKRAELARVFRNRADETRWSLSPNGDQVALFEHFAQSIDVHSFTDHRTRKMLLTPTVHLRDVTWSAAGDGFFVCNAVTKGSELLFVDAKGNANKLWELLGGEPYLRAQSSPDGRRLAIDATSKSSNLWVLEDF